MANGEIPAGWYPDPSGAGGERWWDGMRWTEHVRPQGAAAPQAQQPQQPQQAQPAQPVQEPHHAQQVPPGWYPDPAGSGGQRWWDGAQWTDHVQAGVEAPGSAQPEPQPETVSPAEPASEHQPETGPGPQPEPAGEATAETEMADASPQIPAGWYPDPAGGGGERWWDGAQWTEHVQAPTVDEAAELPVSDGAPATEPEAAVPEPVASAPAEPEPVEPEPVEPEPVEPEPEPVDPSIPAGWYPDPAGGDGQRWWDGQAWTDHVQTGAPATEAAVEQSAAAAEPHGDVAGDAATGAEPHGDVAGDAAIGADDQDEHGEDLEPSEGERAPAADVPVTEDVPTEADDVEPATEEVDDVADPSVADGSGTGDEPVVGHATPFEPEPAGGDEDGERSVEEETEPSVEDEDAEPLPTVADAHVPAAVEGDADDPAAVEGDVDDPAAVEADDRAVASADETDGGTIAAGAIPAGWYADPSGQGERWWTGDAWSEHVRTPAGAQEQDRGGRTDDAGQAPVAPEAQPTGGDTTEGGIAPVEPGAGSPGAVGGSAMPGATAGAGAVSSPGLQHRGGEQGFTMTGVGAVPPTGPPPDSDDDGGGGSRKLIVIILLVVVLLAAIGAALWFFTDVFDQADPVPAAAEEPDAPTEVPVEEEPEPEEPADPTFTDVREVDVAVLEWSTTCVGTEASPSDRATQPQPVTFDDATSALLWHDNPHHPSGLPAYSVDLGSVSYGDATGNGGDDAVFATSCEDTDAADTGIAVWSLDDDGHPFQQPPPPIELATGEAILTSLEVDDGRVVVTVDELHEDGTALAVVTEYVLDAGSWTPNELEREEPPLAVDDDAIPGIAFEELGDDWSFELRPTPQAPLIATHAEVPATFIIALDESLLGMAGPDLDFGDLVEEWSEILEAVAEDEDVDLPDDWFSVVEVEGADAAVRVLYEGASAEVNYYLLLAEVGDLVVEVSVQVEDVGWIEEELREDVIELFATFSFDPDVLMAAYEGG